MARRDQMARFPVFGVLADVGRPARRESMIEIGVTVLFATLPIWFGIIIGLGIQYWAPNSGFTDGYSGQPAILKALYSQIDRGELFMYAAALTGPVLYEAFRHERQNLPPFPSAGVQMTIWIVVIVVATGLFLTGRLLSFTNLPSYIWCSIALYAIGVVLLIPLKAFSHSHGPSLQDQQRREERSFMDGYQSHRGK